MVLIILVFSAILAFIFLPSTKPFKKNKVRVDRNDKYKIPPVFWDEYNWLQMKIYKMERQDTDTVQARINEFIYKYEQFVDFNVFNEKVSHLLSAYQRRVSLLLNNKHLEHGTSV